MCVCLLVELGNVGFSMLFIVTWLFDCVELVVCVFDCVWLVWWLCFSLLLFIYCVGLLVWYLLVLDWWVWWFIVCCCVMLLFSLCVYCIFVLFVVLGFGTLVGYLFSLVFTCLDWLIVLYYLDFMVWFCFGCFVVCLERLLIAVCGVLCWFDCCFGVGLGLSGRMLLFYLLVLMLVCFGYRMVVLFVSLLLVDYLYIVGLDMCLLFCLVMFLVWMFGLLWF